eukprot:3090490-Rhodomonas_salina.1
MSGTEAGHGALRRLLARKATATSFWRQATSPAVCSPPPPPPLHPQHDFRSVSLSCVASSRSLGVSVCWWREKTCKQRRANKGVAETKRMRML